MKLQALIISLLISTGCASTSSVSKLQKEMESTKKTFHSFNERLAMTTYKAQAQGCQLDGLVCLLASLEASTSTQKTCVMLMKQCIATAADTYKTETGHDLPETP